MKHPLNDLTNLLHRPVETAANKSQSGLKIHRHKAAVFLRQVCGRSDGESPTGAD
jgi:hypothetical protein